MKIALVGPSYPFRGGITHFTVLLAQHLRRKHEVQFFTYWRQYPAWLFPGNTDRDPSQQVMNEAALPTLDSYNPVSWVRTARRMVDSQPDLLLLQWWTPFWIPMLTVLARAAHRAKIPVIFHCHQLVEPDSSAMEWQVARLGLRLGDGFVAVTQRERAMLHTAFPQRPVVLGHHPAYEGFSRQNLSQTAARQLLNVPSHGPVLLAFGFVRKYKGLRYLLRALAQVPMPAHLVIAGEFWEPEEDYRRLIAELGLKQRVTLHNRYIPNEDIEPYFTAANVLVLPYISGSQSGAGMLGLHFGLPILATAVGGLAETVRDGENGLIVPPANAEALAAAIRRFLTEGLEASMRVEAARARERLSWPALVTIIEDLTHELKRAGHLPVGAGAGLQRSRND